MCQILNRQFCCTSSVASIYRLKASSGVQSPVPVALVATNSTAQVSAARLAAEELTRHQA
jgi:hypothetical protein